MYNYRYTGTNPPVIVVVGILSGVSADTADNLPACSLPADPRFTFLFRFLGVFSSAGGLSVQVRVSVSQDVNISWWGGRLSYFLVSSKFDRVNG